MDQRYTGTGGSELDGNGTGSGEIEFGTGGLSPKTDKREAAMMIIYIINLSVVQHLHVGLIDVFKFRNYQASLVIPKFKNVINLSEV